MISQIENGKIKEQKQTNKQTKNKFSSSIAKRFANGGSELQGGANDVDGRMHKI